mmetsp:Transcript_6567/g.23152  ORF Transcript_6567/g.23152 Transcript_6567/m.23152 type:complete len:706 (-) Transcript_6567:1245-3362(-)
MECALAWGVGGVCATAAAVLGRTASTRAGAQCRAAAAAAVAALEAHVDAFAVVRDPAVREQAVARAERLRAEAAARTKLVNGYLVQAKWEAWLVAPPHQTGEVLAALKALDRNLSGMTLALAALGSRREADEAPHVKISKALGGAQGPLARAFGAVRNVVLGATGAAPFSNEVSAARADLSERVTAARRDAIYGKAVESEEAFVAKIPAVEAAYTWLFCMDQTLAAASVLAGKHKAAEHQPGQWRLALAKPWGDMGKPNSAFYALKLALAIALAGWFGDRTSGSGTWASLAVAFVGPSGSSAVGGSFHTAELRLQGTVGGALFAYFALVVIDGNSTGAEVGRLLLLAAWAGALTLVRYNKERAYAGIVAAFTAYVVVMSAPVAALTDRSQAQDLAHRRIEQNLLGLLVFVGFELLVRPVLASTLAKDSLVASVCAVKSGAKAVLATAAPQDCNTCHVRDVSDAGDTLAAASASISKYVALQGAAAMEPVLWSPPFNQRTHSDAAKELGVAVSLLSLLREGIQSSLHHKDSHGQLEALVGPTQAHMEVLSQKLCALLGALETHSTAEVPAAVVALEDATLTLTESFAANVGAVVSAKAESMNKGDRHSRKEHRILATEIIVPWHAVMMLCEMTTVALTKASTHIRSLEGPSGLSYAFETKQMVEAAGLERKEAVVQAQLEEDRRAPALVHRVQELASCGSLRGLCP